MGSLIVAAVMASAPFSIEVRVVEAVERGPVVIEATATYTGANPIDVHAMGSWFRLASRQGQGLSVKTPRPIFISLGPFLSIYRVSTGYKRTERILVHRLLHTPLRAGPVPITFECRVPRGTGDWVAYKTVNIPVRPYTPSVGAAFREDADKLLRVSGPTAPRFLKRTDCLQCIELANKIVDTHQPDLVPVALSMIEADIAGGYTLDLTDFVWDTATDVSAVHDRFIRVVLTEWENVNYWHLFDEWSKREMGLVSRVRAAAFFFGLGLREVLSNTKPQPTYPEEFDVAVRILRRGRQRLPDDQLQRLFGLRNVWLRSMVYAAFPERVPPEWKRNHLGELAELVKPLNEDLVSGWVRLLDSDDFSARERAAALLLKYYPQVKGRLATALAASDSAEVRRRITAIIECGRKAGDPHQKTFFKQPFMSLAGSNDILRVLSEGDPALPVVQDARRLRQR